MKNFKILCERFSENVMRVFLFLSTSVIMIGVSSGKFTGLGHFIKASTIFYISWNSNPLYEKSKIVLYTLKTKILGHFIKKSNILLYCLKF